MWCRRLTDRRDASLGNSYLGWGWCQKLAQYEHPNSREHRHGSPLALTNPSWCVKRSNPWFPVLSRSPPASATEPSFTSRRTAPEWLSLCSQINPSLQPKGLNSIWRTVNRGEAGWGGVREAARTISDTHKKVGWAKTLNICKGSRFDQLETDPRHKSCLSVTSAR